VKTVIVDWQPSVARFEARGGHGGQVVAMNAPHEGAPTGFSASEMLLAGAGGCSAWDVVEVLHKQRQRVTAIRVRVEGHQSSTPPWPFEQVRLHYTVTGHRLNADKVRKAVELSERKYCAVIATIRGVADVTCLVDVRDADDEDGVAASEPVATDATA
jgi:putative redox protein